jgi:TolB-like protein/Tfp pilus assembly protein PilF
MSPAQPRRRRYALDVALPETKQQEGRAPETEPVRPGALSALLEDLVRTSEGGAAWESTLVPGAVIGRFELVREVGRGGFGMVYEARDKALGRTVAFKALRAGARPAMREERLLREAEAAARLSHPNIVTLHDVGNSDHGPYLVMELLRGRTLAQRLGQGPVTVRETLRVAVEVGKGLAHAHAHGVIHRDLTPGNVYLCDDGQVKVLDFGMAHAFGRRKLEGGTPAYMAPEQWRGAPEDERTDVFALGVILYRMLANELPFPQDGAKPVLFSRPAPALDVAEMPALGQLVDRMLERDPVKRPRDAGDVLAALTAFQQELARTPSTGKPLPVRMRRRSARRWALLAAAGALLGAGAAGYVVHRRAAVTASASAPSIAVMPFADLSPQKDQEYFSEGLSEEILNALAHVEGLHVAGRSSAFAFKGRNEDLRTIGQRLNVGAVLEGSVRKAGNRVRITAQVINVADGYHLWSETFDRDQADIFAVQDEIAKAVVAALRVKLLPGEAPSTREHRTANPRVYELYLLGRQSYARFTEEGFRGALQAYEKALALDPGYAPAWSGIAIQLSNLSDHAKTRAEGMALMRRALAAAEKAIALDPDLAEGYAARGLQRAWLNWDWRGAQADMDRALALAAGDANTQRRYGILLAALGRQKGAIAAARKAVEIDPLFAGNWMNLGGYYLAAGQLDLARSAFDRVLEMSPGMGELDLMLAMLSLCEGKPAEALAIFQRNHEEKTRLWGTAIAQRDLHHSREASQALGTLIAKYGSAYPIAIASVYAWWGENDRAFEWLDRAYAQHDPELGSIREKEGLWREARNDPRFRVLLRKLNLPVDMD